MHAKVWCNESEAIIGSHLIGVFIWPGNQPGESAVVKGYNVHAWTLGGMILRAVSDLGAVDLDRFVHLLRTP